jgi:hypothetical protein
MGDLIKALDSASEEERLLFLSAREVKNSTFWNYLLNVLDEEAMTHNATMMTKLMTGDDKAALIAAAQIQAIGSVLETMDTVIRDIEDALNQEQEG